MLQLAKFDKSRNAAADGKRTISFNIIKTSYNQAVSTEMAALKSNNTLNLREIVEKSEMTEFATKWSSYGKFILISILHALIWYITVT
jgi:hypothetical protein